MNAHLQTIRARAGQFIDRNAARVGSAVLLAAATGSVYAADATETSIAETMTKLVGYGVAILGIVVAIWGIRKAIGMFGR